jgi:hypothetical protein
MVARVGRAALVGARALVSQHSWQCAPNKYLKQNASGASAGSSGAGTGIGKLYQFLPRMMSTQAQQATAAEFSDAPRIKSNYNGTKGVPKSPTLVEASKSNLTQSPWRMRFLVMLVSNAVALYSFSNNELFVLSLL